MLTCKCPQCRKTVSLSEFALGQRSQCPHCAANFLLAAPVDSAPPASRPASSRFETKTYWIAAAVGAGIIVIALAIIAVVTGTNEPTLDKAQQVKEPGAGIVQLAFKKSVASSYEGFSETDWGATCRWLIGQMRTWDGENQKVRGNALLFEDVRTSYKKRLPKLVLGKKVRWKLPAKWMYSESGATWEEKVPGVAVPCSCNYPEVDSSLVWSDSLGMSILKSTALMFEAEKGGAPYFEVGFGGGFRSINQFRNPGFVPLADPGDARKILPGTLVTILGEITGLAVDVHPPWSPEGSRHIRAQLSLSNSKALLSD
jgi:hypothetical protein